MKTYCKSCGHDIEKHDEEGCTYKKINWLVLGLGIVFGLGLGIVFGLGLGLVLWFGLGLVLWFGLLFNDCECSEVHKKPKHVHKYECVDCGEKKAIK